jgi:hypothetical protein
MPDLTMAQHQRLGFKTTSTDYTISIIAPDKTAANQPAKDELPTNLLGTYEVAVEDRGGKKIRVTVNGANYSKPSSSTFPTEGKSRRVSFTYWVE